MSIVKSKGYALNRPFYPVDPNAVISAGMVAFLAELNGEAVATTAASGTVPIGTFWKDHNTSYVRATLEEHTFDSNDEVLLNKANVHGGNIKVTDASGTPYVSGTDFSVNATNGIVTRDGGGSITAGETVTVWYEYEVAASAIMYQGGVNYDRLPDDTLGSGKIAVVEGWAHIYTDQFDVNQTYTLNASLRSNASSQWTTETTAYPICGKVIQVPTVDNPVLGIQQTVVLSS